MEIDRAVILLYLEEKPYKEIAEIIDANSNNIDVRIKVRLKKLRRRIKINISAIIVFAFLVLGFYNFMNLPFTGFTFFHY